ncbi:MAG: DUF4160 domain-containing protein [Coprobacillus sp.]|nr:DUF4160 domain-containing protein [Coprobacillus sp.]
MPTIAIFDGISILMHYAENEHNPPHVHVVCAERYGVFDFNGNMLNGDLEKNTQNKIKKWISIHKEELIEMWNTQNFKKLDPLD